ncbi:MAG: DUF87 domain-containing protein [Desulforudis sp.]|jgi:hypothetical protein|nr:MAG: DUF87 domain-containing protein [Desulforudis sp.]
MKKQFFFPAIAEGTYEGKVSATAAIRLASIQSVRLRQTVYTPEEENKIPFPYFIHRPLLQALSSWPENVTVSLNLLTSPVPEYPLSGKIEVAILVTVSGKERPAVIADLLSRSANLFSLLSTFLVKAEFEMITYEEKEELNRWLQPFTPETVYAIDRFHDTFVLTAQSESEHLPMGFLTSSVQDKSSSPSTPSISYLFPWHQSTLCDLATVANALLFHPSPLWLQFRLRPGRMGRDEMDRLEKSLAACEELLDRNQKQSILSQQAEALRTALSERMWLQNRPVFKGGCFLCSESEIDEALVGAVAEVISPIPEMREQPYLPTRGGVSLQLLRPHTFLDPNYFSPQGILTVDEATCAFRIPWPGSVDPPGFPIKSFRSGLAASNILNGNTPEMILLGHNRHSGHINPVRVSDEDRFRHMCVMGQTGTGKSVFLESLVLQDINQGKGVCFIDPHGDSIEKILQLYPEERADDLILIDFLDRKNVVPFNILACRDEEERDKIIDDFYAWLDTSYDLRITGGPMFEQYFRGFFRLLMDKEIRSNFQPTITDFSRLFSDQEFRYYCMAKNQDQSVKEMIRQALDAGGEAQLNNMAPYITSKMNRFTLDSGLRLMTGQESMQIDFQEVMDTGKVMLVKLGRGRFGETISGLLASQIVSRFQAAVMKRIDMKPHLRKPFFLVVDEFQNIVSDPFIAMMSEVRKLNLGLIVANQYADQLERRRTGSGDSALKAILGNVGGTVCFRLGVADSKTMADVFHPAFTSEDLVNLPIGNCYINLKTSRSNPSSFSLETTYLQGKERPSYVAELREHSNSKYTIPIEAARENLQNHNQHIVRLLRESRNSD